ncbi:MAG: DinB family protein [Chitinophagaceae bacterium]
MPVINAQPRRKFLKTSLTLATGLTALSSFANDRHRSELGEGLFRIGPMEGYSPHIGTMVSMLNYNRDTVLKVTKNLSMEELDHQFDQKSNSIGALLMHLGAVDKWYQINSFEGRFKFTKSEEKLWKAPMQLGDLGRKEIKNHDWKYYADLITEVRAKTLEEFKKKDDTWLLAVDPSFSKTESINTYWKWFHVCEHESNHRGQITWLKGRLPGATEGKD